MISKYNHTLLMKIKRHLPPSVALSFLPVFPVQFKEMPNNSNADGKAA
jgi:hypothetical protein